MVLYIENSGPIVNESGEEYHSMFVRSDLSERRKGRKRVKAGKEENYVQPNYWHNLRGMKGAS